MLLRTFTATDQLGKTHVVHCQSVGWKNLATGESGTETRYGLADGRIVYVTSEGRGETRTGWNGVEELTLEGEGFEVEQSRARA